MKDVLRTVPLSPFAPIRSVIAKKMQENEEKNIKIVAGSKKSSTFATAIEREIIDAKDGPFVYRLGRKIFILERGVRFPQGLPNKTSNQKK